MCFRKTFIACWIAETRVCCRWIKRRNQAKEKQSEQKACVHYKMIIQSNIIKWVINWIIRQFSGNITWLKLHKLTLMTHLQYLLNFRFVLQQIFCKQLFISSHNDHFHHYNFKRIYENCCDSIVIKSLSSTRLSSTQCHDKDERTSNVIGGWIVDEMENDLSRFILIELFRKFYEHFWLPWTLAQSNLKILTKFRLRFVGTKSFSQSRNCSYVWVNEVFKT